MKPRVLMTTRSFRIVQSGNHRYPEFTIEVRDGRDATGEVRWREVSLCDDPWDNRRTLKSIVSDIGRQLATRELRARRKRKGGAK